jgi:hypothetical protein
LLSLLNWCREQVLMRMRGIAIFITFIMLLSGCFSSPTADERIEEWGEGQQDPMDIYVFVSNDESNSRYKFESCPWRADYLAADEIISGEAVFARPLSGFDENGELNLVEPTNAEGEIDFEGGIAIMNIDDAAAKSYSDHRDDTMSVSTSWMLPSERNASALIWGFHGYYDLHSCDDIIFQFDENFKPDSAQFVDIPLIIINPDDMKLLIGSIILEIQIGPKGFVPIQNSSNTFQSESLVNHESLGTKIVSNWVSEHEDCLTEAGAWVNSTSEDSDANGVYSPGETTTIIQCDNYAPTGVWVTSVLTSSESGMLFGFNCLSRSASWDVTEIVYSNGTIDYQYSDAKCDGATVADMDDYLISIFCTSPLATGTLEAQVQMGQYSIRECVTSGLVGELSAVLPQIQVDYLSPGDSVQCPSGGLLMTTWADTDMNGNIDSSELLSRRTICNGSDGLDGQNGIDSPILLTQTVEAAEGACSAGGLELLLGRDWNDDTQLSSSEIEHSFVVCNGLDGEDGVSSMINLTSYNYSECDGIYVRILNGLDLNEDQNLSLTETLASNHICLPSHQTNTNSTFIKEIVTPNAVCLNGGVRAYIWIDENYNSITEDDEIFMEVYDCAEDETVVVCSDSDGDCIADEFDDSEGSNDSESSVDTDWDGVPNDEDQCEGHPDYEDINKNGTPDGCDDDY